MDIFLKTILNPSMTSCPKTVLAESMHLVLDKVRLPDRCGEGGGGRIPRRPDQHAHVGDVLRTGIESQVD